MVNKALEWIKKEKELLSKKAKLIDQSLAAISQVGVSYSGSLDRGFVPSALMLFLASFGSHLAECYPHWPDKQPPKLL